MLHLMGNNKPDSNNEQALSRIKSAAKSVAKGLGRVSGITETFGM